MVFEEFFLKKKIDLAQLKDADPNLFEQFKSHYSLMGEKSFDHTKKFWFNRLRHVYPLSAEEETRLKELLRGEKHTPQAEAVIETPTTETAVAKPAGFRPKFKAPAPATSAENADKGQTKESEAASPETAAPKPVGFKPRFNAAAIAKKAETNPTENTAAETEKSTEENSKPIGFKPRFKAGVTTAAVKEGNPQNVPTEKPDENTNQENTVAKPVGFKPRFKAGVTKTATENTETNQENVSAESNTPETADATTTPAKPLGFKPRFKAGVTTTAQEQNTESVKEEAKTEITEENKPAAEEENKSETPVANKPLGFKPRFKAGK